MFSKWGVDFVFYLCVNSAGLASGLNRLEIHKLDNLGLRLCEGPLNGYSRQTSIPRKEMKIK